MFSAWEYNVDKAAERLLVANGWRWPDRTHYTSGAEIVEEYLIPLATKTPLRAHIRTDSKVEAITRRGYDKVKTVGRESSPFEVRYRDLSGMHSLLVDAVIDTSGTWFNPNPAGANGLMAIGEERNSDHIAYAMPDVLGQQRLRYEGKAVAVLGAGHSAIGTLVDLARLQESAADTTLKWLVRGGHPEKSFGGGSSDQLVARGELGTRFAALVHARRMEVVTDFSLTELAKERGKLKVTSRSAEGERHLLVDELIIATGFRPDYSFLRELRTAFDPALECPPALAPLIDPNEHSCGTVRPHGARELAQAESGLYVAGMKSYGRAPTFLLVTGYEQVRSIVAEIAGDHEAAARVELVLPETGVCNGPGPSLASGAGGCCGAAAGPGGKAEAQASTTEASGSSDCGCDAPKPAAARSQTCCG
jgi:thioredoxin reductase